MNQETNEAMARHFYPLGCCCKSVHLYDKTKLCGSCELIEILSKKDSESASLRTECKKLYEFLRYSNYEKEFVVENSDGGWEIIDSKKVIEIEESVADNMLSENASLRQEVERLGRIKGVQTSPCFCNGCKDTIPELQSQLDEAHKEIEIQDEQRQKLLDIHFEEEGKLKAQLDLAVKALEEIMMSDCIDCISDIKAQEAIRELKGREKP